MLMILAIVACQAAALNLHAALTSDQAHIADQMECTIVTEREWYRNDENIVVRMRLVNHSDKKAYVLKESWSGGVWLDREHTRIVLAHYAFTKERENELRQGWTIAEIYVPQFYDVEPGQERFLEWSLGDSHELGKWKIEGKASILPGITGIQDLEGGEAAQAMAKLDVIIPCKGKTITIQSAEHK